MNKESDNINCENMFLFDKNIYVLPVGNFFGREKKDCYLIFSPLKNRFFLATPEYVSSIEEKFKNKMQDSNDEIEEIIPNLPDVRIANKIPSSHMETSGLFILLNEKCNFKCSYCYSAKGRSKEEVTFEQSKILIDQLILNNKYDLDTEITYMGGGEPLLSWPLIVSTASYAANFALEEGKKLHFSLSTNGSLISEEMIKFFQKNNFHIQVSFEVLPEIQKIQRGDYDSVHNSILKLLAAGIDITVRSTVTRLNVERLEEVIDHVLEYYPGLHSLVLEPVYDPIEFNTRDATQQFFDMFEQQFFKAVKRTKGTDLRVGFTAYGSIRMLRYRYCSSLYCLTPYGTITDCPNISSPQEEGYKNRVYGELTKDHKLVIIPESFKKIYRDYVNTDPKCIKCWAKWNCGGGCQNMREIYKQEIFDVLCNFFRNILLHTLMDRLCERYYEETRLDLVQHIKNTL